MLENQLNLLYDQTSDLSTKFEIDKEINELRDCLA